MTGNYLNQFILEHLQKDIFLLNRFLLIDNHHFFIFDFEKQENLWLSNTTLVNLGYLENNANELNNWKSILNIDSIFKKDFSEIENDNNFQTEIVFTSFNGLQIKTDSDVYIIRNNYDKPSKLVMFFDNFSLQHNLKADTKQLEVVSDLYTNKQKNFSGGKYSHVQEQFNFISDNISDGIFVVENGKMIYASNAYLKMGGLTYQEKEVAQHNDPLHNLHPEDKERIRTLLSNAIANKVPIVKYIFRCKLPNNDYMWREDSMNLQYFDNNSYKAIIITRDITKEKIKELSNVANRKKTDLQNNLLLKLYTNSSQLAIIDKINLITKIALEGLAVDRSNYWELDGDKFICKNHNDITHDKSTINLSLNITDLPIYFKAIEANTAIIVDDILTSNELSELVENYLKPLGITNLLDIPVRENGKVHGILCFEHRNNERKWSAGDISFARSLADFLSLSLEEDLRKKTEQKLLNNQERLKFISENTSDGILVVEKSKITYVSSVYVKLSGYTEDFIKKLTVTEIFEMIHPDDVEKLKKIMYSNIDAKIKRFSYEYRIKGTNNLYYWREDSVNVIYKENQIYEQIIIITRDITERKKNEQKLVESEQQLRLISEHSTDGFIVIKDYKVSFISPAYARFLGFVPDEIIDNHIDIIFNSIHHDDKDWALKFIYENLNKQVSSFKIEFRIKSESGKYHWREDLVNIEYDKKGNYTAYIIISRDIHERKITEQKLIDSEQQLRLITENTSDGLYTIENNVVKYVSPAYLKLIGLPSIKNLTSEDIFSYFHIEDANHVKAFIYKSLRKQVAAFKYEVRFKDISGNYHWREDSANVLYNKKGEYLKYIVVTRDISERKEAELERTRLHKITETQNKKLVNFTHIVSHDIRSHTSNLSMILDLFEETKDIEDQEKYFRMMKESTNKLSDTIYYLNETVAVQSGQNNDFKILNLKKEIEKAIEAVRAFVKTNEATLIVDIDSNIKVKVTQPYLESIMFNLLTNAIKYKSNKRKPEISIIATEIENEIQLTIKDNGIGIDLERNKDKIFGMYKTFHGNEDAVGLGLFMVKNHIESMGGRVEVDSAVDRGTTFKLFFV